MIVFPAMDLWNGEVVKLEAKQHRTVETVYGKPAEIAGRWRKAGADWLGKRVDVTTLEFRGGRPIKESAAFRAYDSWADALEDYKALITGSERYRAAVDSASEPDRYAAALQEAGYATDPDYAAKIRHVLGSEVMVNARKFLEELIGADESSADIAPAE